MIRKTIRWSMTGGPRPSFHVFTSSTVCCYCSSTTLPTLSSFIRLTRALLSFSLPPLLPSSPPSPPSSLPPPPPPPPPLLPSSLPSPIGSKGYPGSFSATSLGIPGTGNVAALSTSGPSLSGLPGFPPRVTSEALVVNDSSRPSSSSGEGDEEEADEDDAEEAEGRVCVKCGSAMGGGVEELMDEIVMETPWSLILDGPIVDGSRLCRTTPFYKRAPTSGEWSARERPRAR